MKSYTDITQSKKLADILPPESADMCWGICDETLKWKTFPYLMPWRDYTAKEHYLPCWSFATLFDILPAGKVLLHDKDNRGYKCICHNIDSYYFSNPIDTCVDIIIKLHEQKLI